MNTVTTIEIPADVVIEVDEGAARVRLCYEVLNVEYDRVVIGGTKSTDVYRAIKAISDMEFDSLEGVARALSKRCAGIATDRLVG